MDWGSRALKCKTTLISSWCCASAISAACIFHLTYQQLAWRDAVVLYSALYILLWCQIFFSFLKQDVFAAVEKKPCLKKRLICPPNSMTQQTKLQKGTAPEVCKAEGPELILDLCSSLAESPAAPWLNAIWHVFNRFVTLFLFSWIYIRAAGVSREALILPLPFSLTYCF